MFIAALFTIAKTKKQSKCPSIDEWLIKKMWCMCTHTHTHTHKYYLAMKNNENLAVCINMNGPRDYHIIPERERQLYEIAYV